MIIETFFNSKYFLISNDRLGFGKAAKVIDKNLNIIFESNRFLSYSSKYLLYLMEYDENEVIVLKNMLNHKIILSKRYDEPIINAYLLGNEHIVLLANKGSKIMVDIILIGGSFGATLALLIAAKLNIKINKVIAIAPLMSLSNHLKKVTSEEIEWFNERFSIEEVQTIFNWKSFINEIKTEVFIIQGDNDSVLNYSDTLEAVNYAHKKNLPWTLHTEHNGDHVPETYQQRKNRFMLINYLI